MKRKQMKYKRRWNIIYNIYDDWWTCINNDDDDDAIILIPFV